MKKALAFLMAAVMLMSMLTACGNKNNAGKKDNNDVNTEETDKAAADKVAALIDAIYVQERTEETDAQCEAAKAAWDALTDAQKALVEGEEASPTISVWTPVTPPRTIPATRTRSARRSCWWCPSAPPSTTAA